MKRHPFDPFAFIVGVVTIGIGATFLFGPSDGSLGLTWLVPTILLGFGAALVSTGIQRTFRKT